MLSFIDQAACEGIIDSSVLLRVFYSPLLVNFANCIITTKTFCCTDIKTYLTNMAHSYFHILGR